MPWFSRLLNRVRGTRPASTASPTVTADRFIAAGRSAEEHGRLAEACEQYRAAVAAAPRYAKAHLNLGVALEALHDPEGAKRAYEAALDLDSTSAYAAYNLGKLLYAQSDLVRAGELLCLALERKRDFAEAHVVLGNVYAARADFVAAAKAFEEALHHQPAGLAALHGYAGVLIRLQKLPEAEAALRRALTAQPENAEMASFLASVLARQQRLDEAVAWYQKALAINPRFADALCDLGNVFSALGRASDAAGCYRQALALEPRLAEAHCNLGNILLDEGKFDEARACYEKAVELNPDFLEARHNLCMALHEQGETAQAIACLRALLALKPSFARGHLSLANLLSSERPEEAASCLRQALSLDPALAEAHIGLGNLHAARGEMDEALAAYRKALAFDPENTQARWSATFALLPAVYADNAEPENCRRAFTAALHELDRWIDTKRQASAAAAVGSQTPFYLAYQDENNREPLERYGNLCARIMSHWCERRWPEPPKPIQRRKGDALRVGVVSHHFQNHSVWNAIVRGWFEMLDRRRFALEAFYLGVDEDQETRLARSLAAHFHEGQKSLHAWVETIVESRLDVLIFPEIGMDRTTVKLASLRLAPVQAVSWGHPDTSGLPTIDYFLSADGLEPPGADASYTEKLVRLPHLGCFYRPLQPPAVAPDLAALGIDAKRPILLCPGTPFKYAPKYDAALAQIAREADGCQLVFFTREPPLLAKRLEGRLRSVFARSGLDADRTLRFIPWQNTAQFYGLLRRADLFLDTLGFSGFNTAMQAIECGLPIVTCEGRFMRGRLASGILRRMGLDELVADSAEAYAALAARLAREPEHRAALRQRIEAGRGILFEDRAPILALEDFLVSVAP